jgi:hypothetical protein
LERGPVSAAVNSNLSRIPERHHESEDRLARTGRVRCLNGWCGGLWLPCAIAARVHMEGTADEI